jgi:hypothetical protein
MDYGAFRDLQRHRRLNQYVEPLTNNIGYVVPSEIIGTKYEDPFRSLLYRFEDIPWCEGTQQLSAQYVLPMAFMVRYEFEMDLKELYYLVELRTQPAGHDSYRLAAKGMLELAKARIGPLMVWCRSRA